MKSRIIVNVAVALYLSFYVVFGTLPLWWYDLTGAETFIVWCISIVALFVVVSGVRAFLEHGIKVMEWRATHTTIKYDARGRRQDANRLGYISTETICEVVKRGRNGR